jgi:hypothetical protein
LQTDAGNWFQLLAIFAAIGLCIGIQTRALAAVSLGLSILTLAAGEWPLTAVHVLDASALTLIGPGAWSLDAILFGRRTVTLPDRNDTIV